jgi:hypothetical protein
VKTPGRRRASPRKAQPAITTHTPAIAFSDQEDFFQSDHLKQSTSPLAGATKLADHPIDLPSQVLGSHPEIAEETDVAQQSLPSVASAPSTFIDMSVPLKEEDASTDVIARKSSLSQFPSLAAPSPLRKSVRNTRDSSLESTLATTPGTGLTGNHTSWLAKVREAKALEVTNKRASVAPASLTAPSGGVKRKSGEIPGNIRGDSEERKAKILKTGADVFEAFHPEPPPPAPPTLQLPATDVRTARPADEVPSLLVASETDMMAPLKKAIEALRAHTGKSLAGNLVEMNAQEPSPVGQEAELPRVVADVPTRPSPPRPSLSSPISIHGTAAAETVNVCTPTPPKSTQQVAEPTIAPPPREEGKRLSISDLIPKYNKSEETSRTSANETSISTTPPDSPPATKKTAFFVPGGPVFNKPPPVFVPPPTTKYESSPVECGGSVPKGYASQLPGYSLGAPFGLGLQPTKLPRSPPRNLLSGQSTQSSLFSDNVFDSQNNVPAWAPRSQDMTSQESQQVIEENEHPADLDDDDSWRIDDKFAATNQMWTPFAGITAVEDSMTWSTVPSESQIGSKSPRQDPVVEGGVVATAQRHQSQDILGELDQDMAVDDDMKTDMPDEGKPTVNLVTVSKVIFAS